MTNSNVELLHSVYDGIGLGDVKPLLEAVADEIRGVIEIYAEGMRVVAGEIVANDHLGIVLTLEESGSSGKWLTWRGVHLWTFQNGRCIQFEAYAQALVVMIPGRPEI